MGPLVLKKTFADCSFIYCYIPYNIPQPRHYQLADVLSKWVCWVDCYFLFTFHSFFMNIEKNFCKYFEIISEFSKSFIFSLCSALGRIIWDKVFKNGPSNICGRQPFKNLKDIVCFIYYSNIVMKRPHSPCFYTVGRSSCAQTFIIIGIRKNLAKFTGKNLC